MLRQVGDVGTGRLQLVRLVRVGYVDTMFVGGVPCLRGRLHVERGAGGGAGLDDAERGGDGALLLAPATARRSAWWLPMDRMAGHEAQIVAARAAQAAAARALVVAQANMDKAAADTIAAKAVAGWRGAANGGYRDDITVAVAPLIRYA